MLTVPPLVSSPGARRARRRRRLGRFDPTRPWRGTAGRDFGATTRPQCVDAARPPTAQPAEAQHCNRNPIVLRAVSPFCRTRSRNSSAVRLGRTALGRLQLTRIVLRDQRADQAVRPSARRAAKSCNSGRQFRPRRRSDRTIWRRPADRSQSDSTNDFRYPGRTDRR